MFRAMSLSRYGNALSMHNCVHKLLDVFLPVIPQLSVTQPCVFNKPSEPSAFGTNSLSLSREPLRDARTILAVAGHILDVLAVSLDLCPSRVHVPTTHRSEHERNETDAQERKKRGKALGHDKKRRGRGAGEELRWTMRFWCNVER